ncbi:MAG TPA: hypothetical protein VNA25_23255 [Phycisphaerae bacterium]|nr:hypothetical protein [Phycisphaerae bacterium]
MNGLQKVRSGVRLKMPTVTFHSMTCPLPPGQTAGTSTRPRRIAIARTACATPLPAAPPRRRRGPRRQGDGEEARAVYVEEVYEEVNVAAMGTGIWARHPV